MSELQTLEVIQMLNADLRARHEHQDSPRIEMGGYPQLEIFSFQPLAFRTFERAQAPYIFGDLALRAFVALTEHGQSEGAVIIAAMQVTERRGYGFTVPDAPTFSWLATQLGYPNLDVRTLG